MEFEKSNKFLPWELKYRGRVAQLVQSTWFTPKGSGVRIPSRPQNKSLIRNDEVFSFVIFMNYFLYILYSESINKYYVGITSNIEERLKKHLSNHKGFTSRVKDWQVVYFEKFENKSLVAKRERQIKSWKSRKMIEHLIESKE